MSTINASQLNQKIKRLPVNLLQEVDDYIEFLTYKSSQKDWADDLNPEQISRLEKGKQDIIENKIISHQDARKIIDSYLKRKNI